MAKKRSPWRCEQPDLILMDGMMPQISGFDACRKLKQNHQTCLIPIVLVTALNFARGQAPRRRSWSRRFLDKTDRPCGTDRPRQGFPQGQTQHRRPGRCRSRHPHAGQSGREPRSVDGGHVERVSHYSVELGQALGLPQEQLHALRQAGVVHDIGKIAIPDSILLKPGPLTESERKLMQTHVEVGYEMLRPLRTFRDSLPAVRFHHERLNGAGYPLGLRGDQIPISAQIMAVVDVFDALTTDRAYRTALSQADALAVLRAEAERGLHDPELVETFARAIVRGPAVTD